MSSPALDQPHGTDPGAAKARCADGIEIPEDLLTVVSAGDAGRAFELCRPIAAEWLRERSRVAGAAGWSLHPQRSQAARLLPASPRFSRGCTILECVVAETEGGEAANATPVLESLRLFAARHVPAAALPSVVQARVALAQALVAHPRILIVEPVPRHISHRQQQLQFHLLRAAAIEGQFVVLFPTSDARFAAAASSVIAIRGE